MNQELRQSLGTPAIFSNRFYVARTSGGTRIAFAEMIDGEAFYHSAVFMSEADGYALRELLDQTLPKRTAAT